MNSNVKAHCKNCGNNAPADQFKLHYLLRQMVCPSCFSGKTQDIKKKEEEKRHNPKPAGWDEVDEYLAKAKRSQEVEVRGKFEKIPGTSYVQYNCFNCKYTFKYDPFRKRPQNCPYCNQDIPKLKTFNLL